MQTLFNRIKMIIAMMAKGGRKSIGREIVRRFYSNEISYCLRRDLTAPFESPQAKVPIKMRPLQKEDIPIMLNMNDSELDQDAIKERARRLLFIKEEIPTCFVAVTDEGIPCYMQWLITAQDNNNLQNFFQGCIPILDSGEVLFEFVFTHEKFRGQRIMSCAMAQIAEKGREVGASSAIAFVRKDNIPSLKGCKRAGFFPYMTREDNWRFFRRRIEFKKLTPIDACAEFEPK